MTFVESNYDLDSTKRPYHRLINKWPTLVIIIYNKASMHTLLTVLAPMTMNRLDPSDWRLTRAAAEVAGVGGWRRLGEEAECLERMAAADDDDEEAAQVITEPGVF